MGELQGSNTNQLLIEKSTWFITATVKLLATPSAQQLGPCRSASSLEGEKPPKKSTYPSVWKSELSSEATSFLSLPLSSDFIQMRLFFQKKNPREYK